MEDYVEDYLVADDTDAKGPSMENEFLDWCAKTGNTNPTFNDAIEWAAQRTLDIISRKSRTNYYGSDPDPYQIIGEWSEGLAWVLGKNGKYGFIDTKFNEVVLCIYDGCGSFSEGRAKVMVGNKFGFIDTHGNLVVPFNYESATAFESGVSFVKKDGKIGAIDKYGYFLLPCEFDELEIKDECAVLKSKDATCVIWFSNGTGVIDYNFSEGYAVVTNPSGLSGIINKNGKTVVPCYYDNIAYHTDSFAKVSKNNKWFYIDIETNRRISSITVLFRKIKRFLKRK